MDLKTSSKWEISILEMQKDGKIFYKVTRRLPEMSVAETKVFSSLKEAKAQLEEWLE